MNNKEEWSDLQYGGVKVKHVDWFMRMIFSKDRMIFSKDCMIFSKDHIIFSKDHMIFSKDRMIFSEDHWRTYTKFKRLKVCVNE